MWAAFLGLTASLAVLTEELQLGWDGRRGEGSTFSKDGLPSHYYNWVSDPIIFVCNKMDQMYQNNGFYIQTCMSLLTQNMNDTSKPLNL